MRSGRSRSDRAVAKVEKRADVYVSTRRRFVEAMGGELKIVGCADHWVNIRNFADLHENERNAPKIAGPRGRL
jgi:hypothetical protein